MSNTVEHKTCGKRRYVSLENEKRTLVAALDSAVDNIDSQSRLLLMTALRVRDAIVVQQQVHANLKKMVGMVSRLSGIDCDICASPLKSPVYARSCGHVAGSDACPDKTCRDQPKCPTCGADTGQLSRIYIGDAATTEATASLSQEIEKCFQPAMSLLEPVFAIRKSPFSPVYIDTTDAQIEHSKRALFLFTMRQLLVELWPGMAIHTIHGSADITVDLNRLGHCPRTLTDDHVVALETVLAENKIRMVGIERTKQTMIIHFEEGKSNPVPPYGETGSFYTMRDILSEYYKGDSIVGSAKPPAIDTWKTVKCPCSEIAGSDDCVIIDSTKLIPCGREFAVDARIVDSITQWMRNNCQSGIIEHR